MLNNDKYLELILNPIRVCARYKPKFGQGAKGNGLTLSQFKSLYQSDAFYHWLGLDNPLMYAAHKAAGGMTSIYRQIGIGCENLFQEILKDSLGLQDEDAHWSYEIPLPNGKARTLYLDARIPLNKIPNSAKRKEIQVWLKESSRQLGIDKKIASSLNGVVFEVRQGYKSKDAKRQNADIANAATAYTQTYLPCAIILSSQIDSDILLRYRSEKWAVLTGINGTNNPLASTYDFMRDVIGYDLAEFFQQNSKTLHEEINYVLEKLLNAEVEE